MRKTEIGKRADAGESLDDLLPEAFANCREAARRALGLRAFDTQLMGGIFLHQGNIAEQKTGEGKTLTATFAAYLNALTARACISSPSTNTWPSVTLSGWAKSLARLGLTTGVAYPSMPEDESARPMLVTSPMRPTTSLGFDYLRDNMKSSLTQMLQTRHNFAIVDEVDSILIDEARTPLIISGPSQDRSEMYSTIDKLIP